MNPAPEPIRPIGPLVRELLQKYPYWLATATIGSHPQRNGILSAHDEYLIFRADGMPWTSYIEYDAIESFGILKSARVKLAVPPYWAVQATPTLS